MKLSPNSWETIRRLQGLPISVACTKTQIFGGGISYGRMGADEDAEDLGASIGSGSPKADLAGVWNLMFENTYQTGDLLFIATREALQNSVDAIKDAIAAGQIGKTQGEFRVEFDYDARTITWTDNGIGMDLDTIDNVFLSISASKKTAGSAGGFGAAKAVILGISDDFHWRLETRNLIAVSEGFGEGEIKYYKAPTFRQGVKLTIYNITQKYLDYEYDWLSQRPTTPAILRRLLRANDFSGFYKGAPGRSNIRLYFNGERQSPLFKRNRGDDIRLQDKNGPVQWGRGIDARLKSYLRRKSGGAYFVRLDGLIQFIQPATNTDVKIDTTIDLTIDPSITPKDADYPLPISRDTLKETAGTAFGVLRSVIEIDIRSAERKEDYETYLPEDRGGEADDLAAQLEDAMDPELLAKIEEIQESLIATAPPTTEADITSEDVDRPSISGAKDRVVNVPVLGEDPIVFVQPGDPGYEDALTPDEFAALPEEVKNALVEIAGFIGQGDAVEAAADQDILTLDPRDPEVDPQVVVDVLNRHLNARGEEAVEYSDYFIRYVKKEGENWERLRWAWNHVIEQFEYAQKQAKEEALERAEGELPGVLEEARDVLHRVGQGDELTAQDAEVLDKAITHVTEVEMGPGGAGLVGAVGAIGASTAVHDLLPEPEKVHHRKKNPFGRLAALKINKKQYDHRRASAFKRHYAQYIPWLLLLDQAIRITAAAGGYRGGKIFPGFILDDGVQALAEKPDRIGTDRFLYVNPDSLGDYINPPPVAVRGKKRKRRPKPDPFLIAAWLNASCCHEMTHLRGYWTHDEAFVIAREALGEKSAKTIPLLAELAAEILGIPRPVSAEVLGLQKSETKLKKKVTQLRTKLAAAKKTTKKTPCPHAHTPPPLEQKAAEFWDRIVAESQRTQEWRAGEANLQDVDDSFFVYAGHSTAQQVAQALIQDLGADARLEAGKLTGPMEAQALREYVVARFLGGDGSEFGDMAPGGGSPWIRAWDQHVARMPPSLRKDWILDEEENRTAPAGSPYTPWDHPWT